MSILTKTRTTSKPERLYDLPGIGPSLAARVERHINTLHREWRKYHNHDHLFRGFSQQDTLEPTEGLDEPNLLRVIERDPYLLMDVRGIGFKRADAVATDAYGIDHDDKRRHTAGNQAAIGSMGALPMWRYRKARDRLELRNKNHELEGVTIDHDLVWLPAELKAEEDLAHLFEDVLTADTRPALAVPDLAPYGPLNDDQRAAVSVIASGARLVALTGGAGTGKTHTVAAAAKAIKAQGRSMRVMAFAGKAAMRSAEAMRESGVQHIECSTIHRALGLSSQTSHPRALEDDVIVVDEASMLPNWLLAKVAEALKPSATLVLVGDPNQLPPIGHGTPFNDLLELGLPHLHLTQNYRQAGQVSIHQLAEAIRQQAPSEWDWGTLTEGVTGAFNLDPVAIETQFNASIKAAAARHDLLEWQVVTWKNDARHALNQHLQELLNPGGQELFSYRLWGIKDERGRDTDAVVTVGDKVMVTDNDYEHEVFNGQLGIITAGDARSVTVDLRDGEDPRVIPIQDARDLMQLGYAVTVHKAQGSGWETVILYQPEPVTFSPRRFYYTSVTRAKNRVELWTQLSPRAWWTNVLKPDDDPDSTLIRRVKEAR